MAINTAFARTNHNTTCLLWQKVSNSKTLSYAVSEISIRRVRRIRVESHCSRHRLFVIFRASISPLLLPVIATKDVLVRLWEEYKRRLVTRYFIAASSEGIAFRTGHITLLRFVHGNSIHRLLTDMREANCIPGTVGHWRCWFSACTLAECITIIKNTANAGDLSSDA